MILKRMPGCKHGIYKSFNCSGEPFVECLLNRFDPQTMSSGQRQCFNNGSNNYAVHIAYCNHDCSFSSFARTEEEEEPRYVTVGVVDRAMFGSQGIMSTCCLQC